MRALILSLLVASSVARADSTLYTPLVDMRTVDPPCRTLAEIPRHARISAPIYDAAISTASCMAPIRAAKLELELEPTQVSVDALDAAIAPAIAILDAVIATGDPAHQLIAQHSKLEILDRNTERMFSAVSQLDAADTLTEPWQRRALECRRQIARIVYRHPELATRDVVLANIIADSRIVDAAGAASR